MGRATTQGGTATETTTGATRGAGERIDTARWRASEKRLARSWGTVRKNGLHSTLVIQVLYTYSIHNYLFGAPPVVCLFSGPCSTSDGSPPATAENGGE
jgi:hypothetical protein